MSTSVRPLVLACALASIQGAAAPSAQARQQDSSSWRSAMLWYPTLGETGSALAEHLKQIDARCDVRVQPVAPSSGAGPEGAVYGFTITWACPDGAAEVPERTWQGAVLWYPSLSDAGAALTEQVNQIDARCTVDVQSIGAASVEGRKVLCMRLP